MIQFEKRLRRQARDLYRETPAPGCWIQALRPHICPFDRLIDYVPNGICIIDVGCGSGLLLGLLAATTKSRLGSVSTPAKPRSNSASKNWAPFPRIAPN